MYPAAQISASTGKGGKEFEPQDLMGHHFFVSSDRLDDLRAPADYGLRCGLQVVRAIGDAPNEKGEQAQARIAKQYFEAAEDWE